MSLNILQLHWLDYDELQLWKMAKHVADILHTDDENTIQRVALANFEPLLVHGLTEGIYLHRETGHQPWDKNAEETIQECKRLWDEAGREGLSVLDAYFVPTPAGRAELERRTQ